MRKRTRSKPYFVITSPKSSLRSRATSIDVLAERYELDLQVIQLVEDLEEVADGPRHAVERPDHHDIELAAAGVGQELIEAGTLRLGAADLAGQALRLVPLDVLLHQLDQGGGHVLD